MHPEVNHAKRRFHRGEYLIRIHAARFKVLLLPFPRDDTFGERVDLSTSRYVDLVVNQGRHVEASWLENFLDRIEECSKPTIARARTLRFFVAYFYANACRAFNVEAAVDVTIKKRNVLEVTTLHDICNDERQVFGGNNLL